jgi:hypothetical protein
MSLREAALYAKRIFFLVFQRTSPLFDTSSSALYYAGRSFLGFLCLILIISLLSVMPNPPPYRRYDSASQTTRNSPVRSIVEDDYSSTESNRSAQDKDLNIAIRSFPTFGESDSNGRMLAPPDSRRQSLT